MAAKTITPADSAVKFIAYYRVSTKKQGASGLGLEAQVDAVAGLVAGRNGSLVKAYREVETGKIANRPELQKALAHAKRARATLVIAKLDRLARNVAFTANLMDAGVDFVACDNPHANRLTIHILAAVAEDEAKRISERTESALGAYREHGYLPRSLKVLYPQGVPADLALQYAGKLGSARPGAPQLTEESAQKGREVSALRRAAEARAAYSDILPEVVAMKSAGLSLRQIAAALDADGHATRSGQPWNPVQVSRVLAQVPVPPLAA